MKLFRILTLVIPIILSSLLVPSMIPRVQAAPPHEFDYMIWIMMENHDLADISSSSAPYQYNLANSCAQSTNFQYESNAGSLPNYIAATSGSTQGIIDDGNPGSHPLSVTNIVDRLEGAGLTWKAYMEGMPSTNICNGGGSTDGGTNYIAHHDAFAYYTDITGNSARCAKVVQAGTSGGASSCTTSMPSGLASTLLSDLGSTSTASNFIWLQPNNYDNSHDCSPNVGSAYLQAIVPSILSSTVFTTQKAVLLITYDEGHDTCCPDPIYTVFAGPQAKTSYSSGANTYNHYSLLRTIEDNWSFSCLSNDCSSPNMDEFLINPILPPPSSLFDYIVWIMMENHDLADISSSSAPYQYNLANSWAQSTNFQYESNAGSLPNYIAATSGSTQGIIDDGNPGSHPLSVTNIVDRLEGAGLTWKAYMEGMPSTNICNGGGSTDGGTNYIAHHDAFAYYTDITGNSARCAKVVQAGTSGGASSCTTSMPSGLASTLLSDLGSTSTASNFIWLQPNNYDNSHDCSPNVGSAYLQAIVPSILSSTVFTTQKAVLLITYDEGHDTCCPDPIYTVFAGPQAKTSYSSGANTYNHYSLLRTIEDNWSFSCLSNDCSSPNMDEFLINPILPPPSSLFDYIVWIMMENHDLADISSSSAPYQYNLANSWAQSTNFQYESNAGSLYNYIAATSGSMNGITCDGSPNSGCVLPNPGVQNIVDRLAGKSL